MIDKALEVIRTEVKNYIENQDGIAPEFEVLLENIAFLETDEENLRNKLIISLVNIEEERALKNIPTHRISPVNGRVEYKNAPVYLNLYLLFSVNLKPYIESLRVLSYVIQFFQSRNSFTAANSPESFVADEGSAEKIDYQNFKLVFNIYTLTFEQLNHMWGALGGKQVPSVMYRVWLTELEDKRLKGAGELIEQVQSKDQLL